jgi:hypothetical protein
MKRRWFVALVILTVGLVSSPQAARAEDYSRIRIVRLSFVEGAVEYQRPGQDWQDANLNLPIQEGFSLRTLEGYAEIEFEDAMAIRLATNSTLEFAGLTLQDGGRATRLTIPQGTAVISAKLRRGDAVSIAASGVTLTLPTSGRFRVDASPTASWVTVFHGKVSVDSPSGTTAVSSRHTLHFDSNGSGSPEVASNPPQDEFDKWVSHREDAVNSAQHETAGVLSMNSYTTGFADLYNYGLWSNIPGYGLGWMPYGLGAGWIPFTSGQWQFMGATGWNWISAEPWGWIPYHFGSWVYSPRIGWAWLPVGATSWTPATARWVQANNQLGWVPNGPPQTSKATKTQSASLPGTVILASSTAGGSIKAGSTAALSQPGISLRTAEAPAANSAASIGSRQPNALVQSAPASVTRTTAAPSSSPTARLGSLPRAITAPHSMPAPAIARGAASTAAVRGGGSTAHVGGGTTVMGGSSPAASTGTAASGSAGAHSGGSAGSSNGHH